MFKKILIANRGEIACRVAATARRIGVRTVAVYSDADAHAKHVHACDEAVHIGGSAPRESYLRAERILAAAHATGAEAVHPGYGFLSENDAFAQACANAGVVFIGPPPAAIRAMGLKAESKRLMEAAGVPLVPGYHGAEQNPLLLKAEAERIGYPVLIKASAGGGGKGMRVVAKPAEFDAALASCQREAAGSFGSDAVLVERYITRPRHIEIQVFADAHGHCIYLFERDCSVQRRHQKVLEEAPAPDITARERAKIGERCVEACKKINYRGAGTFEFLYEDGEFYFIEMNTRLQVEHPVTELVTGIDIVQQQIRVARNEKLGIRQRDIEIRGHAIECRINAEDPFTFTPSPGRITSYHPPGGPGIRVDTHIYQGYTVPPYYDSMIGKLIAYGTTRDQAIRRMRVALSEMVVQGIDTNIPLHQDLLNDTRFLRGGTSIHFLEQKLAQMAKRAAAK